jgi:ABC-type glutathione transport system ATPase component
VTPEGKIKVGDNTWNIQTELPNNGVEYDADGNVKAVSLKDDNGKTVMYEGQIAEDIAYQTLLNQTQTAEQRQAINEILENDEELNRQLREAEEAAAETTGEVVEPGVTETEVTATEEIAPSEIETTLDEVITPASKNIKEQIARAKKLCQNYYLTWRLCITRLQSLLRL